LQEFDAYVVGEKGAPGIVVVQEWCGIDYEIMKHAINIASKGYWALIPEYVILFSSLPIWQ
jgi:dienelactone hydrolase